MKTVVLALIGVLSAHKLHSRKGDLPYTGPIDKLDPLSRYVNDDDLVGLGEEHSLVQLNSIKGDLPHDGPFDKVDPLSRYVNDDDI